MMKRREDSVSINSFDYRKFHRRRSFLKLIGLVLLLLGLFTLVDMLDEVPIPLVGYRAIIGGTLLSVLGCVFLYNGYKLPIREAVELIHSRPSGITESELVHVMMVDKTTAQRILNALVSKGFVRGSRDKSVVADEVFEAVR